MKINIQSETGRLKKVIVHTPGREVSLVNPAIKEELLFDDIVFEEDARAEHLDMLRLFKAAMPDDGEILEITDLALTCFQQKDIREEFINLLDKELPFANVHTVRKELLELSPEKFLEFVLEGSVSPERNYNIHPAPNLLFTRDLAAVANNKIILSRAAKPARIREFLMMEMIVSYHPLFEEVKNSTINIHGKQSIEGGDVLVPSKDIILIGMSERTSFSGLMSVAEQLIDQNVNHVLAVDIPKQRSSMHLDTIFTFADETECIAFPPAIIDQSYNVVHLFKGNQGIETRLQPSLKESLEELTEREFTFINCGGRESINQYREQWTDGANVFALAPGVIVGYGRNTETFKEMQKYGYKHMTQKEFVEEFENSPFEPEKEGKIAISFEGHELCRGRGGARCMTLPVLRS